MDYRVTNFDACPKTVDQDTTDLPLEERHEGVCLRMVGLVHVQGCRKLALQALRDRAQCAGFLAAHHE